MADTISLKIPNNTEYIAMVRISAAYVASKLDFDIETIEDIKIAISEACNNAIQHSNQENDYFEIEYTIENNAFVACIKDSGKGFADEEYCEPNLEQLNENGLGIYIMKTLMDKVVIEANNNQGTCVKLFKYQK